MLPSVGCSRCKSTCRAAYHSSMPSCAPHGCLAAGLTAAPAAAACRHGRRRASARPAPSARPCGLQKNINQVISTRLAIQRCTCGADTSRHGALRAHRLSSERTAEVPSEAGVTETAGAPMMPYSCTSEPSTKAGRSTPAATGPTLRAAAGRAVAVAGGGLREAGKRCTVHCRIEIGTTTSLQNRPAQACTAPHACTVIATELLMLPARLATVKTISVARM